MIDTDGFQFPSTQPPINITVTNPKPDPAISATLLKDLEKEARDRIESAFRIRDNHIDVACYVERSMMQDESIVVIIMNFNGKKIRSTSTIERLQMMIEGKGHIIEAILKDVADVIAREILMVAIDKNRDMREMF